MSRPGTPSLLRAMNDRAVLDLLISEGPLTRTDLGGRTGLSKVTVSQLLGRLEARGLVEVVGAQTGSRGPNAALYCVVPTVGYAAGVDVGPDGITVAVADITGAVRGRGAVPGGSDDLVDGLHKALSAATAEAGVPEDGLQAVVIGTPGVVDPETDSVDLAVDVPAWSPELPEALRRRLRCRVGVENDVNLAALAEQAHGGAAGADDFVLLWVSRGLGIGIVLGGRLHRGASGGAGEVGYLPVPGTALPTVVSDPRAAAFQSLVGGHAVCALAARHGLDDSDPAAAVAAAAATADHPLLDELGDRLAVGVAAVCVVLDPSLVVLAGDVGRAGGAALAGRIQRAVPKIAPVHPAVRTTEVAGEAVLTGAIHVAVATARDAVFDAPA
ncbi:ROK family transcriptional regulator [Pseudonocardia humida]|uniref:ROK family transcriptional regulator n=1 Tax=Pseudonocardia humida TaxID=2800819 RepID=A0ABT1A6H0_9PSEU|nr:ROK family transcriptional regulator [Pseudonocardia humida]MCO1658622.1 ROK family transcriptional regulator [Pseudonocardia humida]